MAAVAATLMGKHRPGFDMHQVQRAGIHRPVCASSIIGAHHFAPNRSNSSVNKVWKDTSGPWHRFVRSTPFEMIGICVIMINIVTIGIGASQEMSYILGQSDTGESQWIKTLGYVFIAYYVVELVIKMIVLQREFFVTADRIWNYFDIFLVLLSLFDILAPPSDLGQKSAQESLGENALKFRFLRLLKLAKMLRMVKVMATFRELRLILHSIAGSMRLLMWSSAMLMSFLYLFAILFLQGASELLLDPHGDEFTKQETAQNWGGLFQSMCTLYKAITGGDDWGNPAASFESNIIYYLMFLAYITFMAVSVLNVLTGVIVEAAMGVAHKDQHDAMAHALGEEMSHVSDARHALRKHADGDSNTTSDKMDWAQLLDNIQQQDVLDYFEMLDLEFGEVEGFFRLLQNRGGDSSKVQIDDFLAGCLQLKAWGPAKAVDLVYVAHDIAETREVLETQLSQVFEEITSLREILEQRLPGPPTVRSVAKPVRGESAARTVQARSAAAGGRTPTALDVNAHEVAVPPLTVVTTPLFQPVETPWADFTISSKFSTELDDLLKRFLEDLPQDLQKIVKEHGRGLAEELAPELSQRVTAHVHACLSPTSFASQRPGRYFPQSQVDDSKAAADGMHSGSVQKSAGDDVILQEKTEGYVDNVMQI